jgi:hypothetical protein
MGKYKVAVALLCFLAATCTNGSAWDVQQEFVIGGSVGHLGGMMAMRDASRMSIESKLLDRLKPDISPEELLEIFKAEESKREMSSRFESHLSGLSELIRFASNDVVNCVPLQVKVFLYVNQVDQSPQPLLKKYMNYYGAEKFEMCAKKGLSILQEAPENEFEEGLDEFFSALLGLSGGADDEELAMELRQRNLLKDGLDVYDALEILEEHDTDSDIYECEGMRVLRYLVHTCEALEKYSSATYLDSIILIDALEGELELDDRTRKLIEYQNACWYVLKYPHKMIENVHNQLGIYLNHCDEGFLDTLGGESSNYDVEI